jgi:hypothetical protein
MTNKLEDEKEKRGFDKLLKDIFKIYTNLEVLKINSQIIN